ncbi:MAG: Panacea domain-containing protein [Fusobacteriaceae bacterium]
MKKYNSSTIAKYLICKCHSLGREITNLKLQKLLYFAQGHYMQENDGNFLFEQDFQAWAHGPVIPDVYQEYKVHMWFNLPKVQDVRLEGHYENFLEKLLEYYGAKNGKELEITSHDEQPWRVARNGLGDYKPSTAAIPKDSIFEYYKNQKQKLEELVHAS